MVRESSADGRKPPQESGEDATQPLDLRGGAANLTQELAQLLAASIAQNQPGKRLPGNATGSELASLAALVSSQRAPVPSLKDGLSSLSYAPAVPASAPGSGLLLHDHGDDEPMPIPSTWRQPTVGDDERSYRQQLGAAALGLVAGLIVVIPSVLWLSGWMGGPQARSNTRHAAADAASVELADARTRESKAAADIKPVKVVPIEKTESATQFVAASIDPRAAAEPPPTVVEQASVPVPVPAAVPGVVERPRPRVEDLLLQAERRIARGDIVGAREFLMANEAVAPGPMTFALAETYDPIMLAIWQTQGMVADPNKAKFLYAKALELGYGRARQRLEWLSR